MSKKVRNKEEPKVFVAPDGGWGWMVVIAAGFSNLSTFPVLQQFGLLFRDKFEKLGISSSAMTTIINMNSATTNCIGLANGPIFRKFSFRQVSFVGASTVFIGLMITTFSNSFLMYLISFSILYGAGVGISASANALALNTYFKKRRRVATGLSWTTTGLGPIVMPHIITALFHLFGETGTVLILCGFALHAIAFSLLLQPVEFHAKTVQQQEIENVNLLSLKENNEKKENIYFSLSAKTKNLSAFSSQYLYNEDDVETPGYEIIDPATPMLSKANDGYFSSSRKSSAHNSQYNLALSKKASIANLNENRSRKASIYLSESKKNSSTNLGLLAQESLKPKRIPTVRSQIPESEVEDCPTLKAPQDLREEEKAAVTTIDAKKTRSIADQAEMKFKRNFSVLSFKLDDDVLGDDKKYIRDNHSNRSLRDEERKYLRDNHSNKSLRSEMRKKSNNFNVENEILKQASLKLEQYLMDNDKDYSTNNLIDNRDENQNIDEEFEEKLTFYQKVAMFFDFDLLKDFTYINLMVGITIANFNELNFSILTPFILGDYGISKPDVAAFMSLLAGIDIGVRFCIPFVAGKIGWENNTFFLFGVMTMAIGRIILAYNQSYVSMTIVAVVIGFGKGLRTVFMALVIPSHVPLEKLPGATGIQLLTAGLFFLVMGPVVGWVKDTTSTEVTLHCLNITTYLTAISWGAEKWYRSRACKDKLKSES